ncbi:MAG: alanine racemase [Myxococcota bacterium]
MVRLSRLKRAFRDHSLNKGSFMTGEREHGAVSDRASWIEISADALRHNVAVFRRLLGGDPASRREAPLLGAVVKSNAYGHGLPLAAGVLHPIVDLLCITSAADAASIRRMEQLEGLEPTRLLVLGSVVPEEASLLAEVGAEATLGGGDLHEIAARLRSDGLRLRTHVHVDTGLGREGYHADEVEKTAELLEPVGDVFDVAGVCSHFANVEDVTEQDYAATQLDTFEQAASELEERLGRRLERHIAASAAAMVLPRSRCDVIRAGISIYGLWPSVETRLSARVVIEGDLPDLRPVLSWRCRPQVVKELPAGAFVGYGCTWRASRPTTIAVLPVGYFDGYPRLASGKAHVLVHGRRCPVIGRVMMNHMVVDVSGVEGAGTGSKVTLLGRDESEQLPAELLASWAQTINYEIVARLGSHIERRVS